VCRNRLQLGGGGEWGLSAGSRELHCEIRYTVLTWLELQIFMAAYRSKNLKRHPKQFCLMGMGRAGRTFGATNRITDLLEGCLTVHLPHEIK